MLALDVPDWEAIDALMVNVFVVAQGEPALIQTLSVLEKEWLQHVCAILDHVKSQTQFAIQQMAHAR